MLSGAGFFFFFFRLYSSPGRGVVEGSEEQPTCLAAIQSVGSFNAHLNPPACSVVVAD